MHVTIAVSSFTIHIVLKSPVATAMLDRVKATPGAVPTSKDTGGIMGKFGIRHDPSPIEEANRMKPN